MRAFKYAIAAIGVANLLACAAHADFVNGGAETGDLTGWTLTVPSGGSASAETSFTTDVTWSPVNGTYFGLLQTNGPGSYTTAAQTFAASAGDTLSFDVFFDGGDYLPFNDNAAAQVSSDGGATWVNLWYRDIVMVGDFGNSGWDHIDFTIPTSGSWMLRYLIANDLDSAADSQMGFDNTHLTVIPAPGATLLGVIGLVTLCTRRRAS